MTTASNTLMADQNLKRIQTIFRRIWENSSLSTEQKEHLWSRESKALFGVDDASLLCRNPSTTPRTVASGRPRHNTDCSPSMNRAEAFSAHSAPFMCRTQSSVSGRNPFGRSCNQPTPQLQTATSTSTWSLTAKEPDNHSDINSSSNGNGNSPMRRIPSSTPSYNHGPFLSQTASYLSEIEVYEPQDWVDAKVDYGLRTSSLPFAFPAADTQLPPGQDLLTANTSAGLSQDQWCPILTPDSSSIGTSPGMSRQESIASALASPFELLRVQSTHSLQSTPSTLSTPSLFPLDQSCMTHTTTPLAPPTPACPVKSDDLTQHSRSRFFSYDANVEAFSSPQFSSPTSVQCSQLSSSDRVEDMKRSTSTMSTRSLSGQTRSARRRQGAKSRVEKPIAPKASPDDAMEMLRHQSSDGVKVRSIKSQDGSSKDAVLIPKAPYQRPTHPKLSCSFCTTRPEGFRGEHELRRHVDRMHAKNRKVWICVDASPDGKFLADCKHCRAEKHYGAYYNAAAHLRRAHFNPRKRGRKSKNDERRGGKGGGKDPPMEVLKKSWIKEIEIACSEIDQSSDDLNESLAEEIDPEELEDFNASFDNTIGPFDAPSFQKDAAFTPALQAAQYHVPHFDQANCPTDGLNNVNMEMLIAYSTGGSEVFNYQLNDQLAYDASLDAGFEANYPLTFIQ